MGVDEVKGEEMSMTGKWIVEGGALKMVIPAAEFEAELQRALAWQCDFDRLWEAVDEVFLRHRIH